MRLKLLSIVVKDTQKERFINPTLIEQVQEEENDIRIFMASGSVLLVEKTPDIKGDFDDFLKACEFEYKPNPKPKDEDHDEGKGKKRGRPWRRWRG